MVFQGRISLIGPEGGWRLEGPGGGEIQARLDSDRAADLGEVLADLPNEGTRQVFLLGWLMRHHDGVGSALETLVPDLKNLRWSRHHGGLVSISGGKE